AHDDVAPDERPQQVAVVPELGDLQPGPAACRLYDGDTGRRDVLGRKGDVGVVDRLDLGEDLLVAPLVDQTRSAAHRADASDPAGLRSPASAPSAVTMNTG